jgi:hypothetical protein
MAEMLASLKKAAKAIPPVCRINASMKAARTVRTYRRLDDFYRRGREELRIGSLDAYVQDLLRDRLSRRNLNLRGRSNADLRILYVGTDRAQDCGGFLQSLERLSKVLTFTKADGEYGHYFYGSGADARRQRAENGRRLLEIVEQAQKEGPLHIVMGQMWGRTMSWQTLKAVRDMGIVTANICMDDRHTFRQAKQYGEWMGSMGLIPGLDLALTAAPEVVRWYAVEGCPAVFWPPAGDPEIFHPAAGPHRHDVCFVGANYGVRSEIVRAIRRQGVEVVCYGHGWPNGRIATQDVPGLFAASRIVLGVGTIGHCTDFFSLKMRDFEAPMSGSLYLTHNNPDLHALYRVGEEIVTYSSPEECADQVVYYLSHESQAQEIARAGCERARREHTWENRFKQLLAVLT